MLNQPIPAEVLAEGDGVPWAVWLKGERLVLEILEAWRVEDEWWRERPVSRHYFTILLDNGVRLTVFHDLLTDQWYEQRYA